MKNTRLNTFGKSHTSVIKRDIQAYLREIVMLRDGGCILRHLRHCRGLVGESVIQADHLITRANSGTYADSRLVVCVCRLCHFWKKYHEAEYNQLVRSLLPQDRIDLWDACEKERLSHRAHKMDWAMELVNLKVERGKLKQAPTKDLS